MIYLSQKGLLQKLPNATLDKPPCNQAFVAEIRCSRFVEAIKRASFGGLCLDGGGFEAHEPRE